MGNGQGKQNVLAKNSLDGARYMALDNCMAIPCVEHVLWGIACFLRKFERKQEESACTSIISKREDTGIPYSVFRQISFLFTQ
ncbi:hypothetical protein RZO55_25230 [Clostridium boliviensis]|uniref:Uncharacterized protein n=1 Tax=Clostridium boliviensis TaxID=318465 RepID=A0ABU4GV90_9CLOT|nr:hypothetical protein [Clostridium boliviensis]MDW2800878.1 hypothetical protein [Clostridium boliviensis]